MVLSRTERKTVMANLKTWKRGSMTNVIGEATRELDEYKNNVDEE